MAAWARDLDVELRFIEFMPLDAPATGPARPGRPGRRDPGPDVHAWFDSLDPRGSALPSATLPRRPRRRRGDRLGHPRLLRPVRPHPPDRGRPGADLPVRHHRARPASVPRQRRRRRGGPGLPGRGRLRAVGPPHQRARLRPTGPRHVPDRRRAERAARAFPDPPVSQRPALGCLRWEGTCRRDCTFARSRPVELPADLVDEDERTVAFMDIVWPRSATCWWCRRRHVSDAMFGPRSRTGWPWPPPPGAWPARVVGRSGRRGRPGAGQLRRLGGQPDRVPPARPRAAPLPRRPPGAPGGPRRSADLSEITEAARRLVDYVRPLRPETIRPWLHGDLTPGLPGPHLSAISDPLPVWPFDVCILSQRDSEQ